MAEKEIYLKNQECLTLIPEIILEFRKQYFFMGSQKLIKLIADLNVILQSVLGIERVQIDEHEMMLLLNALADAQENRDYTLMADILEGDILPFLQNLQLQVQQLDLDFEQNFWDENMEALSHIDAFLYNTLCAGRNKEIENGKYQKVIAINGQPILKVHMPEREFYMHSMSNPQVEGRILADTVFEAGCFDYIVFGMGMGYHVQALLKKNKQTRVTVLENEIIPLQYALEGIDWRSWLKTGRLKIIYNKDIASLTKNLKQNREVGCLMHYPSIEKIDELQIRGVLERFFVSANSMREQRPLLDYNFKSIQQRNLPECQKLKHLFEGKTVLIAGGGPSIDEEMDDIKEYRQNLAILAVGTIARKLMKNGIMPDAIIISDPQEHMYQQIENLDVQTIPLILLSTASAEIVPYYKGKIYVAYQEGYDAAERLAAQKGYTTFQTGGSVSTLALDLVIRFKAGKIILAGLDMAYTGGDSHAAGIGRKIDKDVDLQTVVSTENKIIYTSKNLDIYRKWIEHRIEGLENPVVYNTGRGARIEGTIEKSLEQIMNKS